MDSNPLISVHNVSRYYGQFCAVNQISFEVNRGQILGFLGPNGAGKSTTMQMLTGNLAPSQGQIQVNGYDLLDYPLQAKSALGYLPEHPPLYLEMRVNEYLRFCARLHQVARNQITQAIERVCAQCGLNTVYHKLIGHLSKGYQQRVGIAQAIIHAPEVVLLDEPTIGLDPIQIQEIRALIRQLGQQHSVILSTHILSEVQAICTQVQIINRGHLILNDTISGLLAQMHTTHVQLGLHHPPALERLQQIEGVEQVEQLEATRFRIQHDADNNPTQRLAEQAVTQQWGLYELIPEQRTLEQVFVELTQDDYLVTQEVA
ncbi:MAG: ATP-binding cassette domain-containing protein [Pseudomonadota bacterium]|nr:ATP-binding cassette domain-containing protein [Pseudomonadota bacterium]